MRDKGLVLLLKTLDIPGKKKKMMHKIPRVQKNPVPAAQNLTDILQSLIQAALLRCMFATELMSSISFYKSDTLPSSQTGVIEHSTNYKVEQIKHM